MRKAVIRSSDGFVANVIEWEPGTPWQPPSGYSIIDAGDGSPGDTWDGTKFIKPSPPTPPPNVTGFLQALINQFGQSNVDTLLSQYPTFKIALDIGNWAAANQVIKTLLSKGTITQAQYNQVVQLANQYSIPFS